MHTERHINVKNFEGIRLKRLRSGGTARNMSEKANMLIYRLTRSQLSPHDAGQGAGGCRAMIKSLQPCPKRYIPTDAASPCCTTTGSLQRVYGLSLRYKRTRKRMNYSERRGQFPHMRIHIRPQAGDAVQYAPRVCTLVLFIFECFWVKVF